MDKIETLYIDTSARNFLDVLKQTEYYIASCAARKIEVLKLVCIPDATVSRVVRTSLKRAVRKCKAMNKIEFFVFGENFHSDDASTEYLCTRAEYVKDDEDFGTRNENIAIVYIKSKK